MQFGKIFSLFPGSSNIFGRLDSQITNPQHLYPTTSKWHSSIKSVKCSTFKPTWPANVSTIPLRREKEYEISMESYKLWSHGGYSLDPFKPTLTKICLFGFSKRTNLWYFPFLIRPELFQTILPYSDAFLCPSSISNWKCYFNTNSVWDSPIIDGNYLPSTCQTKHSRPREGS